MESEEPVVYDMPEPVHRTAVFPKWKDSIPAEADTPDFRIPEVGKDFVGFKEALAFNESGRRYDIINKLGYLGKYQFGMATLRELDMHVNHREFLSRPELQEEAFKKFVRYNRRVLADEIEKYEGKYINGIKITESGILAAAHLAGAGAVQKFLRSGGKQSSVDAFGTRIEDYLRKFAGYRIDSLD
ncbi:MAG: peptidoglycan-binding protein LysM [Chlorobi bacterium]|nr:peptidoglycan-binding protein LysM [Chlorobiota bacterium]